MNDEKITVYLHALDWTMGEFAFFDIKLSGEGKLTVAWGDGHVSHYQSHNADQTLRVEHDYGKKAKIGEERYVVTIECSEATVKALHTGCIDIAIDNIDFSRSPSIEWLNMSWLGDIDLSPITGLKHLVCHGSEAIGLDMRNNVNLETLDCSFSKVQRLRLSRCANLREIDCTGCSDLRDIVLSNNSQLSRIKISPDHNIKPKSWEVVQRIIEKNHGEITHPYEI